MVSVIVPAFNEAARISAVLEACRRCRMVDEIVVVDDGSEDATAEVAGKVLGVTVLRLPRNRGKAGAMKAGANVARGDVLLFIDADLVGVRPNHIESILRPILNGECEMCVGVFRSGRFWSTHAQRLFPGFSGQRAVTRSLFERIPQFADVGMGAEITLNTYARRLGARVRRVVLPGVSNTHKERKMGVVRGTAARAKMYKEMAHAVVRAQRRRSNYTRWN